MSTRVAPAEVTAAMGAEPTDEQWTAIAWPLEPCVLIAGAGSGKTSVMAARVVYLALGALGRVDAPGVMPGNVLCLTFTNKATENLRLRVRRALAHLELAEGEEPEIMNYHGFAASLLDRYGVLAGFEPGARVLSQAQREELCGRVLDRMTFEHAAATYQPSLVSKILELDDQLQNHRVGPAEALAWLHDRLETLKNHKSERSYRAAQERIELTEAAIVYRELKTELGVIDFGDQIDRAIEIVTRFPDVVADHRARFQAVLLDEYQDTNVAQAELMAALFGGGHPVTAVGDPDQNIYAWRGASLYNLFRFPDDFPRADGTPAARLPLYTNFRSGARILAAADTVIAPVPEAQRPPGKRLVPWAANGQGEVRIRRVLDEWTEAGTIADRCVELHTAGSAWAEMAVLCRTSRLFGLLRQAFDERGVPVEIVGLAGLLKMPEVVEVLAYARAVHDPTASVALARILLGPRYRVGFKDIALLARLASVETAQLREAYDMQDDDVEAEPVLLAEALEHLEAVEDLSEDGRAAARRVPRGAPRVARRSAAPGRRVPRRGDPADRDPRRARRRPRPAPRARRAPQPRGVPRRGPRVRAGRGRAHAARLPRSHRGGRAPRQAGVGAGAALRRRLGQGDDDPRREGPRVRPRVRARVRARAAAEPRDPAEPRRARQVARLRAPRRRRHPAALRRQPLAVQGGASLPGDDRGAAHRLRGADARAYDASM